jgi:hypothetical protein
VLHACPSLPTWRRSSTLTTSMTSARSRLAGRPPPPSSAPCPAEPSAGPSAIRLRVMVVNGARHAGHLGAGAVVGRCIVGG